LFTGFTLGAGFKGGEVTPLFYWSHIRKRLSTFVPLPLALLAGMGFVAVFLELLIRLSCTVMGIELFGIESGLFVGLACFIAYLASGPIGTIPKL
jgi:H+/Cl- antiporter ClcA